MTEKRMAVVTATANVLQSTDCRASWGLDVPEYVVVNGDTSTDGLMAAFNRPWVWNQGLGNSQFYVTEAFLGVVPAFAIGVQKALDDGYEIIACLHDDLLIEDPTWVDQVRHIFKVCPHAGLVGFGGAVGLGDPLIYQKPYDPMQLARRGFMSNMRDAEAHGMRTEAAQRVAVLDGFSQIGLAACWRGVPHNRGRVVPPSREKNLFTLMADAGIVHHGYDAFLGCYAKRLGWQVWLAPVKVHHYGGRTAVGSAEYQTWAKTQNESGDAGFWRASHQWGYEHFRDVLPI